MVSGYSALVQFQCGTRKFVLFTLTLIINNLFTLSLTKIHFKKYSGNQSILSWVNLFRMHELLPKNS